MVVGCLAADWGNMATTTEQRERFEGLVRKAEKLIAKSPREYRLRVGALALLGYLFIFGLLALLLGLIAAMIALVITTKAGVFIALFTNKLFFVLPVLIWFLAKGLWVRFEPPAGWPIHKEDAPGLFQELDKIRKQLALPRIHEVLITPDCDACIAQTPRLGIFGWHRNTLGLGFELLLFLTPGEMRAVIAHEAAHLSRNHSRFNGWIYRVRMSWHQIMESFDNANDFAARMLAKFFDWYVPYFDAMSFALARTNEYEADAIAAEIVPRMVVGSALKKSAVAGTLIEEDYWRPLLGISNYQPEPPKDLYSGLLRYRATANFSKPRVETILRNALLLETGHQDTHPALKDRLSALDIGYSVNFPGGIDAATIWLGESLGEIAAQFDSQALEQHADGWREFFTESQNEQLLLLQLTRRSITALSSAELWQRAWLTEKFRDANAALTLYQCYHEREPDDREADLAIGRILIERGDDTGLKNLERATEHFPVALPACEIAYGFLAGQGRHREAHDWRLRGEKFIDLHKEAAAERSDIDLRDEFLPAYLDLELEERLRAELQSDPDVTEAWLAQKRLSTAPEFPLYIIVIQHKRWFSGQEVTRRLADQLQLPGEGLVIDFSGEDRELAKKIRRSAVRLV